MTDTRTATPVLTATGLAKRYARASEAVLDGASVEVAAGELVVLTGPSGSGKSTLLAILAGLDTADDGLVTLAGSPADESTGPAAWSRLALVPQALGLLDDLPVDEAVGLPLRLAGMPRDDETEAVRDVLDRLGLTRVRRRFPWQLSLGEQQRTAIGRAVVGRPDIVLLDEPTAHQDARSTRRILEVLDDRVFRGGAVLIATHDPAVVEAADRRLALSGGRVVAA